MKGSGRRVVVTGVAAVSPLGLDAESSWRGLIEGRPGIGPISQFDTEGFASRIAGEVRGFDAERWLEPRDVSKYDRFIHFALACGRMALDHSGLNLDAVDRDRFGVIIGTGIGGLALMERQHTILAAKGPRRLSPFLIPGMIVNMASGAVSIEFGLKGPNSSPATACATGNHAIGEAFHVIRRGGADLMLAGGTEASITPLAVGGFCAMKALSKRNDAPEQASRPFDADRDGFVIGEGCGVLVLEALDHARSRGVRPLAEICGFGMSGDAYHISAPAPDGNGMIRVMRAALADAEIGPDDISYVNAHGTSTSAGDLIEMRAMRHVFGAHLDDGAYLSSTKAMTGHLLGAAGGLESVITTLAIERDMIPPTMNLDRLDPAIAEPSGDIAISIDRFVPKKAKSHVVNVAMSNSFGFGGTNATLIFKKA